MNVLLILGRGTEGTGNTRITIELERYIRNIGHNVKTISSIDKNWGRQKSQINEFENYKFGNGAYNDRNHYDLCIITSVPPKAKKSAKIKADEKLLAEFNATQGAICKGFNATIKKLKEDGTKIVYLNVDHKIHSISRNFYAEEEYMEEFFSMLDRIVSHDLKNDFYDKFLNKKVKPLGCINFDLEEQLAISCDFNETQAIIEPHNKIDRLCYFIGRSATWKGWTDFRYLHENYLKEKGYVSIIEGIEMSINAKDNLFIKDGSKYIEPRKDNICRVATKLTEEETLEYLMNHIDENRNKAAFIYGPFVRNEALNRVAKAKFGMFFSFLGEQYGGPLENTFLEIACVGTIPIIKKELWQSAKFNDDKFTNYTPKELGIVIYDSEYPEKCVARMEQLNNDDKMYNEYVERCQAFCKKQFDRNVIMKKLFDKCNVLNK